MDHHGLDDDRLLRLLGEVLDESDPVPPDAAAAARAADLGRLDAELADLVFDSLFDERDVTLRDGAGDVRSLTFTAGAVTLEIDVSATDLVGRVTPAGGAGLAVEQPGGRRAVTVDDRGRFRAAVEPGPVRLRFGPVDRQAATPWITR